eukprot:364737-Chlamydomonas_euryale.AAC.13
MTGTVQPAGIAVRCGRAGGGCGWYCIELWPHRRRVWKGAYNYGPARGGRGRVHRVVALQVEGAAGCARDFPFACSSNLSHFHTPGRSQGPVDHPLSPRSPTTLRNQVLTPHPPPPHPHTAAPCRPTAGAPPVSCAHALAAPARRSARRRRRTPRTLRA